MMTFVGGSGNRIGYLAGVAGPLAYVPDLRPVGSQSAYFPRDVENDAEALGYLGFLSDAANDDRMPSVGTQAGDMNNPSGAWDPAFRGAVTRFQVAAKLTNDGWIGPQTRTALAAAVLAKNAGQPIPKPPGGSVPIAPGAVPAKPAEIPGVHPASASTGLDTTTMVGIGVGVLVLGGVAWYALS